MSDACLRLSPPQSSNTLSFRVGRTLLSAALEFDIFWLPRVGFKKQIKSDGQECPSYTGLALALHLF
jgi:hypothetical protein